MPRQTNWEPHASIVLDVFGNGKTALRAGYNRYVNGATTTLASGQDPGSNPTASPAWTDVNSDGFIQYQVSHDAAGHVINGCGGSPGSADFKATLGCELDFTKVSSTYGQTTINNVQDPNLLRAFQNKWNVGISHELMHGVSVTFEWFRTENENTQQTFNITRLQSCGGITPAKGLSVADAHTLIDCNNALSADQIVANPQFQSITVYSPIDGHTVPVYDFVSSTVSAAAANNYIMTDPNQSTTYNGFDLGFNARLPRGGRLFGGASTERTFSNNCDQAVLSPSNTLYCDTSSLGNGYKLPWRTGIKLAGTFPLPWYGLIINGAYQGLPGYNEGTTTYTISKTSKYVTCPGNSAAAGCVVGNVIAPTQVSTTLTANLEPTGINLTPRTNQVDFGITKRIKIGRVRIDPKLDMFNALNSHDYYSVTTSNLKPILNPNAADPTHAPALPQPLAGSNYTDFHQPGRFLQGRIFRLGGVVTW
jgi:hypothetical protein